MSRSAALGSTETTRRLTPRQSRPRSARDVRMVSSMEPSNLTNRRSSTADQAPRETNNRVASSPSGAGLPTPPSPVVVRRVRIAPDPLPTVRRRAKKTAGAVKRTTPTERVDPRGGVHLKHLPSKAGQGLTAVDRRDPYWQELLGGSLGDWWAASQLRRQINAGSRPERPVIWPHHVAIERIFTTPKYKTRIALMGAVHAWSTLTTEQAATLVGDRAARDPAARPLGTLFCADLIDLGTTSVLQLGRIHVPGVTALRPAHTNVFAKEITNRISWSEWQSITGGQPWGPRRLHARHNILGAEFCLRYAEYSRDVIGIVGERFCTPDQLAGAGAGLPPIKDDRHSADAALIRGDGARIAIEIVAHTSTADINKKTLWWAKLLAERPVALSGLSVIFVIVGDVKHRRTDARPAVYKAIQNAVARHPGSHTSRTAERIGVVTWEELFPGPHLVSSDFNKLRFDRPTGPPGGLWHVAEALNPASVPGPSDAARLTLLRCIPNLSWMGQTPYWYRTAPPPVGIETHWLAHRILEGGGYPDDCGRRRRGGGVLDPALPLGNTPLHLLQARALT